MQEINILQNEEMGQFIKYVDPENKGNFRYYNKFYVGYVSFQEFSSRVRAGMTDNDE